MKNLNLIIHLIVKKYSRDGITGLMDEPHQHLIHPTFKVECFHIPPFGSRGSFLYSHLLFPLYREYSQNPLELFALLNPNYLPITNFHCNINKPTQNTSKAPRGNYLPFPTNISTPLPHYPI
jgi:hypothetical protein